MGRVKRNRPNFGARGIYPPVKGYMSMNHFVPIVKRNEDLYAFIATGDFVLEEIFVHVSSMDGIDKFPLEVYLYDGSNLTTQTYEIKLGLNTFKDGSTPVKSGEIVRLDIPGIDSIYDKLGKVIVGILLSYKIGA